MNQKSSAKNLGLYVHIPFCSHGKCPYCDFYSLPYGEKMADSYLRALERQADAWSEKTVGRVVDTVYFGGGTPSILKTRLVDVLRMLKSRFCIAENAEITLEANPASDFADCLPALRAAGFNRMSIGLQSAHPKELAALGRTHSPQDAAELVQAACRVGIDNLSLDLMLCTPGQTLGSMRQSIEYAAKLQPRHISAYLLKVEEGTPFAARKERLRLPDDDTQADFYFAACEALENRGFGQYEISNFAQPGFESRHNLKYWNDEEYIGFGPAAHSFFEGRRFFYPRSLTGYLNGCAPVDDGPGGGLEEYCLLRLRLAEGIREEELQNRFGKGFEIFNEKTVAELSDAKYLNWTKETICLTKRGFAVSNSVISTLLFFLKTIDNPSK